MQQVSTLPELQQVLSGWRRRGETVALVPTMGNLHAGHRSLVQLAREKADRVVCSIFVNPTQFGPAEDLESYPRTLEADLAVLHDLSADIAYTPDADTMYPAGDQTEVRVAGLSESHCGRSRPGHFAGVARVVCKFLCQVMPDYAVFGAKDYQQLAVIRRMAQDLFLPGDIISAPTVRDDDGLALSSRNQYLTPEERSTAPELYQCLRDLQAQINDGAQDFRQLETEGIERLCHRGFRPDYLTVSRQHDLSDATASDRDLVILVAAHLGRARLIDNIAWTRTVVE